METPYVVDKNGILSGPDTKQRPAHSGRIGGTITPRAFVVHTTDMLPGTDTPLVKAWQRSAGAGNAAHLLIGRDPSIGVVQFVPLNRNANHAGGPSYGTIDGEHPNRCTIGIELSAAGMLKLGKDEKGDIHWVYDDNGNQRILFPHDSPEVIVHPGNHNYGFQILSQYQIDTLRQVMYAITAWNQFKPFKPDVKVTSGRGERPPSWATVTDPLVVGHITLDPSRKSDPGVSGMEFVRTIVTELRNIKKEVK